MDMLSEIKKDPHEQAKKYLKGILRREVIEDIFQLMDKIDSDIDWKPVIKKIYKFVYFLYATLSKNKSLKEDLVKKKIELLMEAMKQKNEKKIKQILYDMEIFFNKAIDRYPIEMEKNIANTIIEMIPNCHKVNRLLFYDVEEEILNLHISPAKTIKDRRAKIDFFKNGLKKIAKIVERNKRIKTIRGVSDLVGRGETLVKHFGFEIKGIPEDEKNNNTTQLKIAYMTREMFLEKYLED